MSKQKISKEKSIRRAKTMTEAVISLVLVGTCAFFVKNTFSNMKDVGSSPYFDQNDIEIPDTTDVTVPDPNQTIYESFQVDTTDKFKGDLILVNEEHQYFGGDEDLVSITDMNYENEISCFTAVDSTYTILRQVYGPMAEMVQDFYDKYNNDTLIIYGSYRTTEFQQQLYEDDLAQSGDGESTRVAKPGFSEHETGLAFDFTESENHDYDGTGDFAWINANCFKYGFIVRYTEAKQRLTKIQDEPWHFRYVGIPHAYYMDSKDLCLEEYIDLVREHPYDGEHLEFSDNEGNDYEVYFVASDDGSEKTTVPVPTGTRYEISGNNVDGFIVTVYKGQKPVVEEAPTKSFEDSENSEDETDSEDIGESTDESSGSEEY
ncbi:MAG: M15 family metallopeptidase [Ruminococcus sp.]|uniref:M15 family metallopeptidase n=1 Tax=Ruminococcus sp. TaxID=41978 RepID=UPI0025FB4E59|nr:M15 family metallopeptidase [Ruminococcus sp.]MBR6996724.1 M15 family metallopeptidase [Ruminococcus sp.]